MLHPFGWFHLDPELNLNGTEFVHVRIIQCIPQSQKPTFKFPEFFAGPPTFVAASNDRHKVFTPIWLCPLDNLNGTKFVHVLIIQCVSRSQKSTFKFPELFMGPPTFVALQMIGTRNHSHKFVSSQNIRNAKVRH
jgi:hypothetical protein